MHSSIIGVWIGTLGVTRTSTSLVASVIFSMNQRRARCARMYSVAGMYEAASSRALTSMLYCSGYFASHSS